MQVVGAVLAVVGTAFIVFAALQADTNLLSDQLQVAFVISAVGVALLAPGWWMMLHERRTGRSHHRLP